MISGMAVEKFPGETGFILELLSTHPEGISIREIASMLGINRNSAAKYLDMLHMQGIVSVRKFGAAKIYSRVGKSPKTGRESLNTVPTVPDLPSSADLAEREYICQFDPGGNLTYVNQAYCRMLQKAPVDLINRNWRPVISESDCRDVKKNLNAIDRDHPEYTHEFRVITASGEFRWQQWKIRGIFSTSGSLEKYHGSGIDITGWKSMEDTLHVKERELENLAALHREEMRDLNRQLYDEISCRGNVRFPSEFIHAAMENASFMIIGAERKGRIIYLNKKARQYAGHSGRGLKGKLLFDFFPKVIHASWDETWELLRSERIFTIETFLTNGNSAITPVELVLNYLECEEDAYCCCFLFTRCR